MRLKLRASIDSPDKPASELLVGEFYVELPRRISQTVAASARIAAVVKDAADRIKEELEHGRD